MCSIVNKCVLPWLISSMILFFHLGLLADDYFYNGMGTTIIPSSDVDVTAGDHPIEIKKKKRPLQCTDSPVMLAMIHGLYGTR